eukprot:TRINITY_DN11701_c0_g2_i1.p1 TRINITY_DN11701_c0_g2~~TRINITY_DN11701_c0_g2_i1.p1  ORF type:complete len:281 (+),score=49.13 TRINITY_DN11701_c0_g2_i1:416-1258(+)
MHHHGGVSSASLVVVTLLLLFVSLLSLGVTAQYVVYNPQTIPDALVGAYYSQTFSVTGAVPPITMYINPSSVNGLSFNVDTLSGTPVAEGAFSFRLYVSDDDGVRYRTYTLTTRGPITSSLSLLSVPAGSAVSNGVVTASGGVSPYTYAITSGSLPSGLSLASDGTITGTPSSVGSTFSFEVTATDATSRTGAQSLSLEVVAPTITYTSPSSASSSVVAGSSLSVSFTCAGGTAPYSYTITGKDHSHTQIMFLYSSFFIYVSANYIIYYLQYSIYISIDN